MDGHDVDEHHVCPDHAGRGQHHHDERSGRTRAAQGRQRGQRQQIHSKKGSRAVQLIANPAPADKFREEYPCDVDKRQQNRHGGRNRCAKAEILSHKGRHPCLDAVAQHAVGHCGDERIQHARHGQHLHQRAAACLFLRRERDVLHLTVRPDLPLIPRHAAQPVKRRRGHQRA